MISNSYDIIDSRDIVDRFGELTDLIEAGCDDDEASDELGVLIGLDVYKRQPCWYMCLPWSPGHSSCCAGDQDR